MKTRPLTMLRRFWPLALLATVAGSGVAFAKTRPLEPRVSPVTAGPVERGALGTGTVESEAQVSAAFTVPGRITQVRVNEGDLVRAGDELATIDPGEQDRQVSLARRSVDLASASVVRSEAEIQRARTVLEAAQADVRRVDALFAASAVSAAERDAVHERADRAEAELAAAAASRRQGEGGVVVARENVRLHARRLEDATIRSPFDGVVVKRLHEPGDVVSPGSVVLVVASTRKVWARVWMDETVLHDLREGQEARVTLRGSGGNPLRGRLDRVGLEADRQTHELLVDVELVERPARLVFGQRVDAFVVLEGRARATRIPQGACEVAAGRCLVARDGRIAAADVRFGLAGNEWLEVTSGIAEGDLVLSPRLAGEKLTPGRRVDLAQRGAP